MHRNWVYYDTDHAVFQPRSMTAEQLEAGHRRACRDFTSYSSVFRRSFGLPGGIKRLAYNLAWVKVDWLWPLIVRAGLMPFAMQILERVLRIDTAPRRLRMASPDGDGLHSERTQNIRGEFAEPGLLLSDNAEQEVCHADVD